MGDFGDLLPELHGEIVRALAKSKDLGQTIEAIKVAGTLRGLRYDNFKDFTRLVGVLAEKFLDLTREEIAKNFNTPIAKQYSELNYKLEHALWAQPAYVCLQREQILM